MASYTSDDCTGLLAFWADIDDPDYVLRYQQWHNCEHIPERVLTEGFIQGQRYRSLDNRPHFLMFYDTKTPAVLTSDAYMTTLRNPTPWTREALAHFRDPVRDIFQRLAVAGRPGKLAAPYVTSLRFDLSEPVDEERYVGRWLEAVTAVASVSRARLYKADAAMGNAANAENRFHGGGPGTQAYLALIEESLPPEEASDPVKAGDAALEGDVGRVDEECNRYWLEVVHTKAEMA
ncbi:uncharacterized protein HMPREF1541_06600 [Cyphellophora europaea CBS 101466]|uniref:EthD domain-containing protein n=1 Tax=Cyphellophora europaea (strain CBS 101466) TaxID=1220924 RepID=W2RS52_CYPE1|nr:uncharacterized protein HMPREF1541_06600 [Cyphellophora europaea CBS 101466]ETN38563.1 hypothetical protein HMPREF1541_06600 [Cyphellophora europaea CBS 101466]